MARIERQKRDKAVEKTIANAIMVAGDPEWSTPRAYAIAESVINELELPADECEAAIQLLKKALSM
jgi:hypothetical protein